MRQRLQAGKSLRVEYMDDATFLSARRPEEAAADLDAAAAAALDACGLFGTDKKRRQPGEHNITVALGAELHRDGWAAPAPEKFIDLLDATQTVLRRGAVSPLTLARIVGRWVWYLLLQRPLLSILFATFRFLRGESPRLCWLPAEVAREL